MPAEFRRLRLKMLPSLRRRRTKDSHDVLPDNVHPGALEESHVPQAKLYNLVVLGGGYGGMLTALEAARAGARVALIERDRLGGVCLNAGCISSKSLCRTSRLYAEMKGFRTENMAYAIGAWRARSGWRPFKRRLCVCDGAGTAYSGARQPASLGPRTDGEGYRRVLWRRAFHRARHGGCERR